MLGRTYRRYQPYSTLTGKLRIQDRSNPRAWIASRHTTEVRP